MVYWWRNPPLPQPRVGCRTISGIQSSSWRACSLIDERSVYSSPKISNGEPREYQPPTPSLPAQRQNAFMEEGREKSPVRGKPDSVKRKKANAKDLDRDTLDGDSPDGPSGKRTCLPVQGAWDVGSIPGVGDPLEEGLATHSSILAWKTPWTEDPEELQPIGSQRVGHDWSDLACMHACTLDGGKWCLYKTNKVNRNRKTREIFFPPKRTRRKETSIDFFPMCHTLCKSFNKYCSNYVLKQSSK